METEADRHSGSRRKESWDWPGFPVDRGRRQEERLWQ